MRLSYLDNRKDSNESNRNRPKTVKLCKNNSIFHIQQRHNDNHEVKRYSFRIPICLKVWNLSIIEAAGAIWAKNIFREKLNRFIRPRLDVYKIADVQLECAQKRPVDQHGAEKG